MLMQLRSVCLAILMQEEPDAFQLFQYGPEARDITFRKELAYFLTKEYMDPVRV